LFDLTHQLVLVGVLSIACQYLAYRLRLPAILPLLVTGMVVGPLLNVLDADSVFGDLLFPVVSLSVAIILFEGALTLNLRELSGHGSMVRKLCTMGALVTWLSVSVATQFFIDISWQIAFLFGAIVTVTGPTVIMPMLRTIRPSSGIANILRWEGIIIDPIGALLAVLVFEFVVASQDAVSHTFFAFAKAIASGLTIGGLAGYFLGVSLRNNWLPHYLINTAVLTVVLAAFALSNTLAHESGLITVTVAGMLLANMKDVDLDDIIEFKETLSVLLISALFILLASRIELSSITDLGIGVVALLACMIFISRPLSVLVSSFGTGLRWQEIALLSWIAPRGIVAAAVSALFALQMENRGYPEAGILVPLVFLVIVVTVVLQSLTSVHIAKWLGVRSPPPIGILIFGANDFARMFAKELKNHNIPVLVADTNWSSISSARMADIPSYFGNPMSNHAELTLDLDQFGKVLVMSPYKQINPLITFHFQSYVGKESVFSLASNEQANRASHKVPDEYAKRLNLFGEGISYARLASLVAKGAKIKSTRISDSFTFEDYKQTYGESAIHLCTVTKEGRLQLFTSHSEIHPKADWQVISLIVPTTNQV